MNEIEQELRRETTGEVRFDRVSRTLYSTDASIYEIEPLGVVIPKSVDDLQAAVEIAYRHGVPLIARGGGTSIVGNSIGAGIVVDCSKYLNRVLEVNPEESWVRVQPGVVLDQLNAHLRGYGLLFGPDVASSSRANIGGMLGNNSCGAHSIIHGKTVDHILQLRVLLSNGDDATLAAVSAAEWQRRCAGENGVLNTIYSTLDRIISENSSEIGKRFPKILRRVAGYNLDEFVRQEHRNLAKLVVGSEGTLAVISEAKLNLVPLKRHSVLAVIHFRDLMTALSATSAVSEFAPSAIELLDNNVLDLTRGTMEFARRLTFVDGLPAALLVVEFQGDSQNELGDRLDKLSRFLNKERIGYYTYLAKSREQQENVWYIRKAGLGLLMGTRADRKPVGFIEDSAVAPERLPEYIERLDEIVRSLGTEAAYYAHASVGCLHIRPRLNLKDAHDVDVMAQIAEQVSSLALEFGGTISGEHGDGLAHSCWNDKMFGKQLYQAFREVKRAFDPKNILNPGKVVDAQFLTENFRAAPRPELKVIEPFFSYRVEGSFEKAVESCNGNGFCRKIGSGTMCPSYMVTLEENDSTRGRANALRAFLNGKADPKGFTGPELYRTLDLCVACKGCKGECPSNIDMAKLKYEFLYQHHQAHGLSFRDRLFGDIARLSRLAGGTAPASNWIANSWPMRQLLHAALGIHRARSLPTFARTSFEQWFRNRPEQEVRRGGAKVVFFHDTFVNYNYPRLGIAAVQVLEASGYEVILAQHRCCGRPFTSKGMLDQARSNAQFNVDKLYTYAEKGYPIVGLEPSCILTFRDEYPDMLAGPKVESVASSTFLFEEFLTRKAPADGGLPAFRRPDKKLLLHGHCHLKALLGNQPTVDLLRLLPDVEVEVVDSGCCGMAGSFGFEKEHYEISLAMGRRKLFPAVAVKDNGWQIVASGVSCRQQIEHGTGRLALHPVEVLAQNLRT